MARTRPLHGDLAEHLAKAASGTLSPALAGQLLRLARTSFRVTRKGITFSGQGLAELLVRAEPLLPVRDRAAIELAYGGATGEALAGRLIRAASRKSAVVGGVMGAAATVESLAPPLWLALPLDVVLETLVVALVEMHLVAELHAVFDAELPDDPATRSRAVLEAWATGRDMRIADLAGGNGLRGRAGIGGRRQLVQLVRRRLMARLARNVTSVAPIVGAAAGAEINRRATRDLGDALVRDLGRS